MEIKNKGGRLAKANAQYFSMSGTRSTVLQYLKMKFGSSGVDFYISCFEVLCVSDYFLWHFDLRFQFEVFLKDKGFDEKQFIEMLSFSVNELNLFDKPLHTNGYLFSLEFVKGFDLAGLFSQRSIKAMDILNYVNTKRGNAIPLNLESLKAIQSSTNGPDITDTLPF